MFRSFLFLLASVALSLTSTSVALAAERPNFVFFLVDDLGWADVGCNGSTFYETPNIDALAASGMRFTQGYAACPVCSPTRASILTGRHPVRVDITDWIPGRRLAADANVRFEHIEDRDHLELQEITIAEALREQADYQTFFLGKWHLGGKGHWPTDQGFDVNIGGCDKGSPPGGYYAPWKNPNLTAKQQGEYLTERLTDEATGLIQQADRDRPFLLYFSYYNVHTPIQADRRTVNQFILIPNASDRRTGCRQPCASGQSRLRLDGSCSRSQRWRSFKSNRSGRPFRKHRRHLFLGQRWIVYVTSSTQIERRSNIQSSATQR
jgi:arylsulfatase A-like enzyme